VQRGLMVYLRVYSGELTPATEVYNSTRQVKERVSRLLNIQADDMVGAPACKPLTATARGGGGPNPADRPLSLIFVLWRRPRWGVWGRATSWRRSG
jgi:hypothetical protein